MSSIDKISVSGYGHIVPKTTAGKMFCIGYSLVGIPLLLLLMANAGDLMAVAFRWIYRLRRVWL